jgi:hypothetical protein
VQGFPPRQGPLPPRRPAALRPARASRSARCSRIRAQRDAHLPPVHQAIHGCRDVGCRTGSTRCAALHVIRPDGSIGILLPLTTRRAGPRRDDWGRPNTWLNAPAGHRCEPLCCGSRVGEAGPKRLLIHLHCRRRSSALPRAQSSCISAAGGAGWMFWDDPQRLAD